MISDLDQLANERMGLDLAVPAYPDSFLYFRKRSNTRVVTDKTLI